jgi:hypothetical protein
MGQVMKMHQFASETDERISATVRALSSGGNIPMDSVARACGVPKATVYRKLNGTSPWKASEVGALSQFFKIRLTDLYDGVGGRFGPPENSPDTAGGLSTPTPQYLAPYLGRRLLRVVGADDFVAEFDLAPAA